jgi:thioredoxin reductase (NADPH)
MYFANYARSVTLAVRAGSLEKSMSYYLIEQLHSKKNISVETQTTVCAILGDNHVEAIKLRNEASGSVDERRADAVFAFIGADAETSWLPATVQRDARGYVVTGRDVADWPLTRSPYALETSVPGIFAAGDVRSGSIKRVAAGVGEGSMVIAFIHEYLATLPALARPRT